jgi:PPOX class probable F420-dependent enzyme
MSVESLPSKAAGDQPAFLGPDLEAFVRAPRIGVLGYVRSDGRPGLAPIWYVYRDGAFFLSTESNAPKLRALRRDPRVTFAIHDDAPPYRAAVFEGELEIEPMPARAPTDGIATRYLGRVAGGIYDKMTAENHAKVGVTLMTLRPRRVVGFDNTRAIGLGTRLFLRVREWLPVPRAWL